MKVEEILNLRRKFNNAFNLPIAENPTLISSDRADLQFKMMQEELLEYRTAQERFKKDATEVADALVDMQEVLFGMFAEHGMLHLWADLYIEVHNSNMSKLDANGKPILNGENGFFNNTKPLGKVLKSEHFREPNFKEILNK